MAKNRQKRRRNKQKTKNGQPTVPASEPEMNRDIQPPDQTQALNQPAILEPQQEEWHTLDDELNIMVGACKGWGGEDRRKGLLNGARCPLLNRDWVDERAPSLVRKHDEQVYGGGGSPTVRQTSGNSKDEGKDGYTAYFGNNGQPIVPASEPNMSRDIHPPDQTQALPQPTKLEPQQEARQKVPKKRKRFPLLKKGLW